MRFFASIKRFINRLRGRDEILPDGAYAGAVRLPNLDGDAPDFIRIVPLGDFPEHHDGGHAVTREHLDQMVANFNAQSTDLLFDYDHNSVFAGDTRAAGWSPQLEVREDGLYASMPEWTPPALEAIKHREYRYLSPVYFLESEDKQGNEAGAYLHSVAITSDPYFNEGEVDPIGNRKTAPPHDTDQTDTDTFMEREELIEKLGLDEDATDEDIDAALAERAQEPHSDDAAPDDAEEEADASGEAADEAASSSGEGEDSDESAKVNSRIAALEERLEEQSQREQEEQAKQLVDGAITSGKILPSEKAAYLGWAKSDFKACSKNLADRKAGSALPSGVTVPSEDKKGARPQGRLARSVSSEAFGYASGQA